MAKKYIFNLNEIIFFQMEKEKNSRLGVDSS